MEDSRLYLTYQKHIYILAYRYMTNHEDAEEVTQDVLVLLWNHRSHIASKAMRRWISQVTRNTCLDALRRRKSYRSVVSARNPELTLQNTLAIERSLPYYLKAALNRLEEPYRTLVFMRDFEGLSYEIISQEPKYTTVESVWPLDFL